MSEKINVELPEYGCGLFIAALAVGHIFGTAWGWLVLGLGIMWGNLAQKDKK